MTELMRVIFQQEETFTCDLNESDSFSVKFGGESFRPEEYNGPKNITPTTNLQTLYTEGKLVTGNITVEPIPSNYGLITWNGSLLTVS